MNTADEDPVGYGRPLKNTRWTKGRSGNPRKVKLKQAETTLSLIDRLLTRPVKIIKNGSPIKVPALNAIMYQLLDKSLSGNKKAYRVLQEFEAFARQNVTKRTEIVFIDNAYTAAFSAATTEADHE